MGEEFIKYLERFIGVKYKYGGNNPMEGFDCSGLICEGLRAFGYIKADYTSSGLFYFLKEQKRFKLVHRDDIRRGDILFFGKNGAIEHISIAINDSLMLEAGGGDYDTITDKVAIQKNAFVRVRPIKNRTDFYVGLRE